MLKWLGKLVDSNEKELKKLQVVVDIVNSLEADFEALTDEQLRAKTAEFRQRLGEETGEIKAELEKASKELEESRKRLQGMPDGDDKKQEEMIVKHVEDKMSEAEEKLKKATEEGLNGLLPEAFAAVREAAKRKLGQRHFDVQMMGGIVLHQGKIAEMRTGEGKTLVATLPLYLNALAGPGVHLITVNDYLSKLAHHWMGPVFDLLGVTVGSIQHDASFVYDSDYKDESEGWKWDCLRPVERRQAYGADIVYGTNNEFGFDYLRDNMVQDLSQCVQGPLRYSIVDEVDNILIDEARTPLIISGMADQPVQTYGVVARLMRNLKKEEDYTIEEKHNTVALTEDGISHLEGLLKREGLLKSPGLYDEENIYLAPFVDNGLKAEVLFKRDRNYVVKNNNEGKPEVIIVDEFTGRLMPGRRYSEGLHQAIEAKENVEVQRESKTFATITFQNYFRMYDKLAGMTGTALTEAEEFYKIYKLEVVVIPTNLPIQRIDYTDRIYKTETAKFKAVVEEVAELHKKGEPVLIGTVSIEKSELLSGMLQRRGIRHEVLNAKEHEREAAIISRAGEVGSVTVATNMAGRGVDIVLGGAPEGKDPKEWQKEHDKVLQAGGLFIIGTERHEARRIDNQLRGRAGRQGDPGQSRFYVSLEDDVVSRFGGDRIKGIMEWAGIDDDTPIENRMISRSIESAQVKVEGYHFDIRKNLVEFDDVVNQQREIIYADRRKILSGTDLKELILTNISNELEDVLPQYLSNNILEESDMQGLMNEVSGIMPLPPDITPAYLAAMKSEQILNEFKHLAAEYYEQREREVGPDDMRLLEKMIMLNVFDTLWVDHLTEMEHQRLQAGWAGLQQEKSIDAYRRMGGEQWSTLQYDIRHRLTHTIFHATITRTPMPNQTQTAMAKAAAAAGGSATAVSRKPKIAGKKIGRNDPCPCGSGKKYKNCCGK